MEKIGELLKKLDNRVPNSVANKIRKFEELNQRLEIAEEEYQNDPTEDKKIDIEEIKNYVEDFEGEIVEILEELVQKKTNSNNDSQNKPSENQKDEKEKSKGFGVLGIGLGIVLLVASAGAINYFRKNN